MTDRHAGYLVTLTGDVREDDAEAIITALRMVKGVATVKPVPADIDQAIAEDRARIAFRVKLYDLAGDL